MRTHRDVRCELRLRNGASADSYLDSASRTKSARSSVFRRITRPFEHSISNSRSRLTTPALRAVCLAMAHQLLRLTE